MQNLLLWLCACWRFQAFVFAVEIVDVINEINDKINAESNVFLTRSLCSSVAEEVIQNQRTPKFILSTMADLENTEKFIPRNMLTVIFMESSGPKQEQQLKLLSHAVGHHLHSFQLFVSHENPSLHWLFEWCWQQQYRHAIFLDSNNFSLYTYTTYPHLEFVTITLNKYFQQFYLTPNFKGYPLRFAGGVHPPRSIVIENENGELILGGTLPNVLKLFANTFNATLQRVTLAKEYKLNDCEVLIIENKVDICTELYPFGINMSLTYNLYPEETFLFVPRMPPAPIFSYFFAPFTREQWLTIGLSFIAVTVMLSFICWYRTSYFCIHLIFLDVIASFLYLPFYLRRIPGHTRSLLYLLLVLFGFIIATTYAAFLAAVFSAHPDATDIKSVSDLKRFNITLLVNYVDISIFEIFKAPENLNESIQLVLNSELVKHHSVLDPDLAYFCASDKCGMFLYQQIFLSKPRLYPMKQPLLSLLSGMMVQNNSIFKELLNLYIQRLFETGIYQHLLRYSNIEAINMGLIQFFHEDYPVVVHPLDMQYFVIPGMILIIGHTLAAVAFVCELIVHRYGK